MELEVLGKTQETDETPPVSVTEPHPHCRTTYQG